MLAQTEIPNNDISQVRMKEEDYGGCLTTAGAEQIAATIKSHTDIDDRTLILSCQVQVAYLARRLPPSRFATSTAFLSIRNDLPLSQAWLSEFRADLHKYPPAYVLMTANHIVRAGPPIIIDRGASPAFTIAANFMGDRYDPVASGGEAMLYRRR